MQRDTEMQSLRDGTMKPSENLSDQKRQSQKAPPERDSSFLGIMSFAQPDSLAYMFSDIGIPKPQPSEIQLEQPAQVVAE